MNREKLSAGKIVSVSLMLFAMFFGAGNMIFPPMLGYLSGDKFFQGTLGFVVSDAGLSVLGVAAIVLVGTKLDDLGKLVGPRFAVFMGALIYLLIGPLFAMPRTGTVAYEMSVLPFAQNGGSLLASLVFTAAFFGLTYVLCLNPNKLVDIVGRFLTPILLISIAVIFIVCVIHPFGEVGTPKGEYTEIPFFKGLIEGYLALDGFAALAFAIVVINSIKTMGVTKPERITRYTLISGGLAGIALALVYLALGYVGSQTSSGMSFKNGGQILTAVVEGQLGWGGNLVLGLAVLMACLTTSIGLASSFADYFHELFPKWSYRKILTAVCLFSFAVSNVGLTAMIQFTLPALVMVYPPVITLVLLSFVKKFIGNSPFPYSIAMIFAFVIGIFDGLKNAGISLGDLEGVLNAIPFYELGLGWIIPAAVGAVAGLMLKGIGRNRIKN